MDAPDHLLNGLNKISSSIQSGEPVIIKPEEAKALRDYQDAVMEASERKGEITALNLEPLELLICRN